MTEQSGECEEKECLKERVRTNFAYADFALSRDDEDGNAQIAEAIAIEKKRKRA
jgi:hypothetical protein